MCGRTWNAWLMWAVGLAISIALRGPLPAHAAARDGGSAVHDGAHDFDFNIGVWHTHIQRVLDPFSGSGESMVLDGTVTVRRVWDGKAELEEIEADGPKGHWEGTTLFLYNHAAHQWSQTFADSKTGTLEVPMIGEFKDGRGELFAEDTYKDRTILTKGVWSDITPDAHNFTISFSEDGGKTWAPAFIAHLTREK